MPCALRPVSLRGRSGASRGGSGSGRRERRADRGAARLSRPCAVHCLIACAWRARSAAVHELYNTDPGIVDTEVGGEHALSIDELKLLQVWYSKIVRIPDKGHK